MRKVWQRVRFPLLIAGATTAGYVVGLLSWLVIQANFAGVLLITLVFWSAITGFFSALGWFWTLILAAMACVVVGAILGSRESRPVVEQPVVVQKECAAVIKAEQILAEARKRQAYEKNEGEEDGDFGMFWVDLEQQAGEEFWEFTVSRLLYVVQNNSELADPHAEVEPFDAGEFEVSETEQGGEQ